MKAPLKWATIKSERQSNLFPHTVEAIQYLLRARGVYKGRPNNRFDAKTVAAVKAFQRKKGLKVDGVVGPQTLRKLVVPLKRGAQGDAVRAVQVMVRQIASHDGGLPNSELSVDGVFGRETQEAIKTAQACLNIPEEQLEVDGIVGLRSWCILLGGQATGRY